jgi:hypothetical protein
MEGNPFGIQRRKYALERGLAYKDLTQAFKSREHPLPARMANVHALGAWRRANPYAVSNNAFFNSRNIQPLARNRRTFKRSALPVTALPVTATRRSSRFKQPMTAKAAEKYALNQVFSQPAQQTTRKFTMGNAQRKFKERGLPQNFKTVSPYYQWKKQNPEEENDAFFSANPIRQYTAKRKTAIPLAALPRNNYTLRRPTVVPSSVYQTSSTESSPELNTTTTEGIKDFLEMSGKMKRGKNVKKVRNWIKSNPTRNVRTIFNDPLVNEFTPPKNSTLKRRGSRVYTTQRMVPQQPQTAFRMNNAVGQMERPNQEETEEDINRILQSSGIGAPPRVASTTGFSAKPVSGHVTAGKKAEKSAKGRAWLNDVKKARNSLNELLMREGYEPNTTQMEARKAASAMRKGDSQSVNQLLASKMSTRGTQTRMP